MDELDLLPTTKPEARTDRPKRYKVILLNDDYTPGDFVVAVLKAVFWMTEGKALSVMLTAHRRGACVVAVYTREVAETEARQANDMGAQAGLPLTFTTEREEVRSRRRSEAAAFRVLREARPSHRARPPPDQAASSFFCRSPGRPTIADRRPHVGQTRPALSLPDGQPKREHETHISTKGYILGRTPILREELL